MQLSRTPSPRRRTSRTPSSPVAVPTSKFQLPAFPVGNRSSEFHPEVRRVRREGSYIYEEFMPTGGTDVKVYTVGPEYAHAEARKSPVVDGVVMRNPDGKEIRYPVLLTPTEKLMAREVCVAFRQAVCGFDLLRSNGRSYVCDVNGWSFVKNSYKYYDDAACVLRKMFLDAKAPHLSSTVPPTLPCTSTSISTCTANEPVQSSEGLTRQGSGLIGTFGGCEELRCVTAVIRHGDRTPKQKVKLKVTEEKLLNLMLKYNGGKPRSEVSSLPGGIWTRRDYLEELKTCIVIFWFIHEL